MKAKVSIEILHVTSLKEYRDEVFHTDIMARQKKRPPCGSRIDQARSLLY
tara:strand:- start:173 stop:322 length:150 start_codon:yes stop_codon:yes gene_type:complete